MPPLPESFLRGEPVKIIATGCFHTFELNEEALRSILCDGDVQHKKICVVSVAGAFRKGKSFLLDFFLRYLARDGREGWLGKSDERLTGFSWRGGSERETSGIWAWSELFQCKSPNGEEIAVMLLDTQGAFDSDSTVKDCATVFALSTMVSSVQTYNLSQNIQEDNLHHLQLFTEYGRLALERGEVNEKPFQSLLFLVRDWSSPFEYAYGSEGGAQLLEKRLTTGSRHEELEEVRAHIRSCFDEIKCFLMPHPGLDVAKQQFVGQLTDINNEFLEHLKELTTMLLSPSNLVVKKMNGCEIKCRDLLECFKAYIKIYQSSKLPEPKTMLRATSEANNLVAVGVANSHYNTEMEKVCGGDRPYKSPDKLERLHGEVMDGALKKFNETPKMGGDEFSERYLDNLKRDIAERYEHYRKGNESKNLLNVARSPVTLVITMMIMYFVSGLFGLVGHYSLSNYANLFLGISILALLFWSYVRYSGEYPRIGAFIDYTTNFIWLWVYVPVFKILFQSEKRPEKSKQD